MILKYFNIWWQAARRLVKVSVNFISEKKHKNVRTTCSICSVLCCCNTLGSIQTVRKGFKRYINKKPNRLLSLKLLTLKIFPITFHTNFTNFLDRFLKTVGMLVRLTIRSVYQNIILFFSFYYSKKGSRFTMKKKNQNFEQSNLKKRPVLNINNTEF